MPTAPDGPLAQDEGLLHIVGDPVGRGLHTVLKPTVGAITGKVGEPPGEAAERVGNVARNAHKWEGEKKNVQDKDLPGGERIGGNRQTGQNPLGL